MTTLAPLAWRCAVALADHHRADLPPRLLAGILQCGWECAVVLSDEFRDRLTLEQCVQAEIAARPGPERISLAQAGAMVGLFCSVVEGRA